LSWKNNCSPAVNTKSAPQPLHFRTLSVKFMAGIPKRRETLESAMILKACRSRFPVFVPDQQQGPGPQQVQRQIFFSKLPPSKGEIFLHLQNTKFLNDRTKHQHVMTGRSGLLKLLPGNFRPGVAGAALVTKWLRRTSQPLCEPSCDSACVPMLPSRGASHRASDSRSDALLP